MSALDPELQKRWEQSCRSCGSRIIWATTQSGKSIPVDVVRAFGGNLELVADPIGIVARYETPAGDVERWVSHFSTCPHAAEHRKDRKSDGQASRAGVQLAGGTVLEFGKHRGKTLDQVPTGYTRWLRDQLQESLDLPEKSHLRPKNVLLIEAIGATLKAKGLE